MISDRNYNGSKLQLTKYAFGFQLLVESNDVEVMFTMKNGYLAVISVSVTDERNVISIYSLYVSGSFIVD